MRKQAHVPKEKEKGKGIYIPKKPQPAAQRGGLEGFSPWSICCGSVLLCYCLLFVCLLDRNERVLRFLPRSARRGRCGGYCARVRSASEREARAEGEGAGAKEQSGKKRQRAGEIWGGAKAVAAVWYACVGVGEMLPGNSAVTQTQPQH